VGPEEGCPDEAARSSGQNHLEARLGIVDRRELVALDDCWKQVTGDRVPAKSASIASKTNESQALPISTSSEAENA